MVVQSGDYMECALVVFLLMLALYLKSMFEVIIFTFHNGNWCGAIKKCGYFLCLALDSSDLLLLILWEFIDIEQ